MAKPNPRKALAAFLPASIPIPGTDVAVRPLTLAAYAILEKIGSPLVVPSEGVTALDVIPTLYVLTHDPVEVMCEDLAAASVAWADGLAPSALIPIEEAARRQVRAWLDVLPEVEKKRRTPGRRMDRRTRRMGLRNLRMDLARGGFRDSGVGSRASSQAMAAPAGRQILPPLRNGGRRRQARRARARQTTERING